MCLKIRRLLIILENSEKRRSPMITVSINMPNNTNRILKPHKWKFFRTWVWNHATHKPHNTISSKYMSNPSKFRLATGCAISIPVGRKEPRRNKRILFLSLSLRKVETGGVQTIPKSLRAIHVLATPWQPGGKHLNPPAHSRFPQKENASCEHVLSAIVALLFYLCPQVVRERWNG